MKWWWLTCNSFTVAVETDDNNIITDGAPIVRKFVGQPATNLGRWMRKIGGFEAAPLT